MDNMQSTPSVGVTEYCMMRMSGKFFSESYDIEIEFGEGTAGFYNPDVREQTQRVTQYESIIDALNYMAKLGWEVVQVIPIMMHDGGSTREFNFLMKRI